MIARFTLLAMLSVPSLAHAQECAGGRVASDATDWHCCWPSQTWGASERACIGPPSCPAGMAAHGESCVGSVAVAPPTVIAPTAPSTGRPPLAPMDAPRTPVDRPIIAPVAPVAPAPIAPALPSDVRVVPEGAAEWISSERAPTADLNPRIARESFDLDLLISGTTLLSAGYALAIVTSAVMMQQRVAVDAYGTRPLFDSTCGQVIGGLGLIPIVGPLISIPALTCSSPVTFAVFEDGRYIGRLPANRSAGIDGAQGVAHAVLMSISGALQLVGFGLLVGGLVGDHAVLRFDGPRGVRATLVPSAAGAEAGLTMRGTF